MQAVAIKTIYQGQYPLDTEVTVQGWVRTRRDSKAGLSFINLYDGSCFQALQVVVTNTLENYERDVLHLTAGCSITVHGKLTTSQGKGQSVEMQASTLIVHGWVENPETYPISPKHHTLDYLREHLHLRARTNFFGAVTRVRHCLSMAIHRFLHEQGFYWINTPLITTHDCEGAGELFRVSTLDFMNLPKNAAGKIDFSQDFFHQETFLTVSGQLDVESYCLALSKVYTFGPTFRAENSNTTRHLAEFWMIEPEIAFATLQDDADLAEQLLKYVFSAVLNERADDMAFFQERVKDDCLTRLEKIVQGHFERIDYRDAIKQLQASGKSFDYPVEFGADLQTEHERYLAEELMGRPVIVMNYPKDIKAFYMRVNDDGETVAAMDVLAPGIGEIIGGSQREERVDVLQSRMQQMGLPLEEYQWYLNLRRYGSVPHAGFGLGFERLISYVTGVANIRDVIPFPRAPGVIG